LGESSSAKDGGTAETSIWKHRLKFSSRCESYLDYFDYQWTFVGISSEFWNKVSVSEILLDFTAN
jgi:hypothetical protein